MSGPHWTEAPAPPPAEGLPQLQLGGGEVSTEIARKTSSASRGGGLSFAQRAILRTVREQGWIRPVEAGVLVHLEREGGCPGSRRPPSATATRYRGGGRGCCAFASTDGSAALKRLAERGLVKREAGGKAVAP